MSPVIKFISWRNWGLIRYNSVWQNVAALFYVGLAHQWFGWEYACDTGVFLLFSIISTAYGYLINDLADIELDRRAGKANVFHGVSRVKAMLVVLVVLGIMGISGWPFVSRPGFLSLWIVWMLSTTFYSLPPIRLKERGALGLFATIAAQQPLPLAMGFAALGYLPAGGAFVFLLYVTLRGISSDVGHQMRDRERDVAAEARTFAATHGREVIARLYGLSLELEALLLGGVLVVLLVDVPLVRLGKWLVAPTWPLLIAYLLLLPFTLGRAWAQLARGVWVDPYDESPEGPPRDLLHLIHQTFPTVLLPLYLAVWLTVYYWPNAIFVIWLIGLYGLYDPARWAGSWPIRALRARLKGQGQG